MPIIGQFICVWALLAFASEGAFAAEPPETTESKRVKKVMRILNSVGLNDPAVKELVQDMDGRVQDGYLTFGEQRVPGGRVMLHYELKGGIDTDQIELKFQPDNSNMSVTARPKAAMLSYNLEF